MTHNFYIKTGLKDELEAYELNSRGSGQKEMVSYEN